MQNITVSEGQTLIDIAAQYCGDATVAFAIAEMNELSLTDDLTIGQSLVVPDVDAEHIDIVNEIKDSGVIPASAYDNNDDLDGIGYWILENDFVVQ